VWPGPLIVSWDFLPFTPRGVRFSNCPGVLAQHKHKQTGSKCGGRRVGLGGFPVPWGVSGKEGFFSPPKGGFFPFLSVGIGVEGVRVGFFFFSDNLGHLGGLPPFFLP